MQLIQLIFETLLMVKYNKNFKNLLITKTFLSISVFLKQEAKY